MKPAETLSGLSATDPTSILPGAATAGVGGLFLLAAGATAVYFLLKGSPSTPESECREAAERWIPKCVVQKNKRKK